MYEMAVFVFAVQFLPVGAKARPNLGSFGLVTSGADDGSSEVLQSVLFFFWQGQKQLLYLDVFFQTQPLQSNFLVPCASPKKGRFSHKPFVFLQLLLSLAYQQVSTRQTFSITRYVSHRHSAVNCYRWINLDKYI